MEWWWSAIMVHEWWRCVSEHLVYCHHKSFPLALKVIAMWLLLKNTNIFLLPTMPLLSVCMKPLIKRNLTNEEILFNFLLSSKWKYHWKFVWNFGLKDSGYLQTSLPLDKKISGCCNCYICVIQFSEIKTKR